MKLDNISVKYLSVAMVSNITFEPFFVSRLQEVFLKKSISVNATSIFHGEFQSDKNRSAFTKADYIIICLNFDFLYPTAVNDILISKNAYIKLLDETKNKCIKLYNYIKTQTKAPVVWLGFEDYCYQTTFFRGHVINNNNLIDLINNELYCMLKNQDVFIDLKRLIANIGIKASYDNKSKYRWNFPYTQQLTIEICNEVYKQYLICQGNTKKCLILDCDNVLWGGILSEDGIEKVYLGSSGLGRSYQDFQRYLLNLYYHGVILAVCSKNDISDVMMMFKNHNEMILKEEHIACFQVNWNNKADNIKRIAESLNIGFDSLVFVDDSDFEIQSVKTLLPEVTVIKYERDTIYEKLSCFNLKSNINFENIIQRNDTYKTNQYRRLLESESKSYEEYLSALEMQIDIHKALPIEISRISELTQRANKCTNGRRYTVEQVKDIIEQDDYELYSVFVSDKFSNLGLVGTFGICKKDLDLFVLSCRALGRHVEDEMLNKILDKSVLSFRFVTTGKNKELKHLLESNIKK